MAIKEGDFVKLTYTGTCEGALFDATDEEAAKSGEIHDPNAIYGPITIRVGAGHVIIGLDEALVGKKVDEEGEIEILPEKAFGPHDEKLVESLSVSKFKEKPQIGMRVQLENREGIVVNVIGRRAVIDFNPALAGKTLEYHYKIEGIVKGVKEKIKGLIRLYAGRDDLEVTFRDGRADILLPPGIVYDRRWMLWRSRVVHEAFEYIDEINEINLKETFTRPEKKEEAEVKEEAKEEAPAKPTEE